MSLNYIAAIDSLSLSPTTPTSSKPKLPPSSDDDSEDSGGEVESFSEGEGDLMKDLSYLRDLFDPDKMLSKGTNRSTQEHRPTHLYQIMRTTMIMDRILYVVDSKLQTKSSSGHVSPKLQITAKYFNDYASKLKSSHPTQSSQIKTRVRSTAPGVSIFLCWGNEPPSTNYEWSLEVVLGLVEWSSCAIEMFHVTNFNVPEEDVLSLMRAMPQLVELAAHTSGPASQEMLDAVIEQDLAPRLRVLKGWDVKPLILAPELLKSRWSSHGCKGLRYAKIWIKQEDHYEEIKNHPSIYEKMKMFGNNLDIMQYREK
ncbi:hypothetical protein BDZ94DRAFT_1236630 [Collybia nuda]|uniref:Uncharacterized protein n=1 Tax=Collybia nuda TaxID=64659 RepID=A0A9P5Y605_9AGAR|nr:hypothetical protein BDZ94DRAFT_1236630 [Collybia nuda]